MIDTSGMTPAQIQEALEQLQREANKASSKEDALKRMDEALHDRLQMESIGPGRPWVQPEDPSDGYPKRWVAEKDGKFWGSTVSVNVSTPGESDTWVELPGKPNKPTIEGEVEDHAA